MKIYQSKPLRILAAQILAIQPHDTAPLYQLTTDAESVQVDRAWMEKHMPVVGGHVTIAPDTGVAGYMGAIELPTGFDLVGVVDLTPPAEQGQALPEPELPESAGELPATFTFDQFVDYGRAHSGMAEGQSMPWSFRFFDRAVSHENNDCYLITTKAGKTMRFERGDVLTVGADDVISITPAHSVVAAAEETAQ